MIRIGVDSGGTFTDFVVADSSGVRVFKIPSTPQNPSQALISGISDIKERFMLAHGTTVATNAILERRGAKVAFVTNEGFRHLLFLGRQTRPDIYDLEPKLLDLPLTRDDCFVVAGRIAADGSVLEPFGEGEVSTVGAEYDSVAVCLLFSYANETHELEVEKLLGHRFVSLSHQVSPEFREYERACATFLNAYVAPVMSKYLMELESKLAPNQLQIMMSSGGLAKTSSALKKPIVTMTSGPAAGVVAAANLGKRLQESKLISFDVGGTSTDVALIDGVPTTTSLSEIGGIPARLRRLDVHTIGCGGGSIATVDWGGALKVGPESAGSVPGPALYGVSERPALTDAHVVLGNLPLEMFASKGSLKLDPSKSHQVIEQLSRQLHSAKEQAAQAIVALAVTQMARAIRNMTSVRGIDPSDCCLVPFGGAGGLHACDVAEELGITRIALPSHPGVFSAIGLLQAPVAHEASLTVLNQSPIEIWWESYEKLKRTVLDELGATPSRVVCEAELRYKGQSYEIGVRAEEGFEAACRLFEAEHMRRYGILHRGCEVEWVTAVVRAEIDAEPLPAIMPSDSVAMHPLHGALENGRRIWMRDLLIEGECVKGPCLVLQADSTTVVRESWQCTHLQDRTALLHRQ